MKLYRPINKNELKLIKESEWNGFPPRLPEQPIFYPVLDYNYAKKINKWNVNAYGNGYIVEFHIDDDYISEFDIHNVGNRNDNEYWIPSDELNEFNKNIIGKIKLIYESN